MKRHRLDMIAFVLRFLSLLVISQCTLLPTRMLQDISKRANLSMDRYDRMEEAILNSRIHLPQGSPSWYLGASHEMSEAAQILSRRALRGETMSVMLVEALRMSPKDALALLPSVGTTICAEDTLKFIRMMRECNNIDNRYRTYNGRCNNAIHPTWGAALEAYSRFLPPEYKDGVSLPRTDLPSARDVSSKIHAGGPDIKHPYLMALAALFGQFLAHDLAHTPKMVLPDGTRLKCCDVEFENFHPECFPILAENSIQCMEYSRSAPHPGNVFQGCKLGPRQQINQATSYLDLSHVYGTSEETAKSLRSGKDGLLSTQRTNLPMPSKDAEGCRSNSDAFPCFLSGDSRINEHPGVALMHVLFMREHNRIAKKLAQLNPRWDDERIYQESRKIVIAEMQHVTYNEFLPVVLGETMLDKYDLRLTAQGYFRGYKSQTDATISNAAASAGLSFVAALTPKTLDLVDTRSAIKSGERSLLSAFYAPQELYEAGAIERLIAGATAGHSRKPLPPGLNEILLGRYFHDGKTKEVAVDYAAQIIQQGRDHGLPPYAKWRKFCDLPEVNNFQDLVGTMSKETIDRLSSVYSEIQDVDLVTGGLSEAPAEGSVVGPTFLCLLGKTFRNLRLGDRYWYENGNSKGALTLDQLEEIRKITMARILCNNADNLRTIQSRAFILTDPFLNDVRNCSTYENDGLDLTAWKEKSSVS
ncbi:peroxidasin homolog [Cephus cinctus]|uniref:Peroxidasin homolog n=1 Tax=Cephus cinctus TaxID=211228 RepID=A0AAJ7C3H2_CEPCN|nr:peroxidasin homolog [Cephus cinctus]